MLTTGVQFTRKSIGIVRKLFETFQEQHHFDLAT